MNFDGDFVSSFLKILFAVTTISILLYVGCDKIDINSKFVGIWIPESNGYVPKRFPNKLTLFKNGTGIAYGMPIIWKILENKQIVFQWSFIEFSCFYEISGTTLILEENGTKVKYKKQKQLLF